MKKEGEKASAGVPFIGQGRAGVERGVAGINVSNGCSFKRSWWPLWLFTRRTRGWERSREVRGTDSGVNGCRGRGGVETQRQLCCSSVCVGSVGCGEEEDDSEELGCSLEGPSPC